MISVIHGIIFWFLVFFYSVVINTFSYITALFIRDDGKKMEFYQKTARVWGTLLADAALIKIEISGLENIPDNTNVIFTPNHQSYLDIFILLKILPPPFKFVIMRKLFKVPFIGNHITQAGFVSLDRKDRKRSIHTIHLIIDQLKNNESFVIFPEGKLTTDGKIGEFGRGTSVIIQRSKAPVIPIAIDGTFDIMPKGSWTLRPRAVSVKIGKPVNFTKYYDEVSKNTSLELGTQLRQLVVDLKG